MTKFKKDETKAALHLARKLREDAQEKRELAKGAENYPTQNSEPWVAIAWRMEAEMMDNFSMELEKQIETQNFNF